MKNVLIACFCIFFLGQNYAVSEAQTKYAKTAHSKQYNKKEHPPSEYESALKKLDRQSQKSLTEAWELFKNKITKEDPENDLAFKMLYEFQDELVANLNDLLYEDEKLYKQVNTWASDPPDDALAFEEKMFESGFVIAASEGTVYLQVDPDKMKEALSGFLSPAGEVFLEQYVLEEKEPFTEDAGLLISPKSIGKRLLFWEKFMADHPEFPLKEETEERYGMYLYFLLAGMDNTPLFDYDSSEADPEFLNAYKEIVKQYPQSKTSGIVKNYMEILKKSGFKESEETQAFVRQYAEF